MIAPRHRIGYVDGLRAIAVLSVVAFHTAIGIPGIERLPIPWAAALAGKHGVDLFFVLSGFCLSYPSLKRRREGKASFFGLSSFAAKRLVRIVPPYLIAVALLTALALWLARFGIVLSLTEPFSWLTIIQNALFLDGSTYYFNPSFWTLAVELRWYIAFPFLLWLWCRSPRAFATVGVACVVAYATRANSLDISILPAFMLGIVAADMHVSRLRLPLMALPVGIAILSAAILQGDVNVSLAWQLTAFFIVVGAGQSETFQRMLSIPALTAVGVASYSIYLVHEPLIRVLERYGVFPLLAATAAIVAGFAFWLIAVRPFTSDPLRRDLIGWLETKCSKLPARLGFPEYLRFSPEIPVLESAAMDRRPESKEIATVS
jgi:peptidoglycan/LPS O-acetylase OafA/YrhL